MSGAFESAGLWDAALPFGIRCQIAGRLARSSNPDEFRLLTEYLMSPKGDPRIKASAIEALGESPNPEARKWILSALSANEGKIVCGALRGLAKMDNPGDIRLFADLLFSIETSAGIRAEAARALGTLSSPEAGAQLIAAYQAMDPDDEVMREALIDGLGRRNINETVSFFRQVLADEKNPEYRLNILEAVSKAKGDTASFFMDCLSDADSKVRAEAAWNMTMIDGDYGAALSERLRTETDPEVRQRLYEALDGKKNIDIPLILARSLQEEDAGVQLAAYTLIATHLRDIGDDTERKSAELELTDEFERMAVESKTLDQRLRAVIGLRRLQTDGSSEALKRVVARSTDPRVITATSISLEELMKEK